MRGRAGALRGPEQRLGTYAHNLPFSAAAAAARFGLHLDPAWSPAEGPPPVDMHGVVTTYQQVSLSGSLIGAYAEGGYVVLDEIHHAGDEQAWGASLRAAFEDVFGATVVEE